jgi:hypothetical protein
VQTLAQKLDRGEFRDVDHYSRRVVSPPTSVLFFCAHLHAVGKRAEANALVAKLFSDPATATATLADALNVLADMRYMSALAALAKTNDWASLRDTVSKLRTEFGLRWRKDAGTAILLERLDARAKGIPELAGEGITDAQRALARELAESGWDEVITMPSVFWLLPRTQEKRSLAPPTLADRVLGCGVETLPLLVALADDETLTPSTQHNEYYGWSMPSEGDRGKLIYNTMPRPQTRGELATGLLQRVVPDSGRSERRRRGGSEPTDEQPLKLRATALYEQLRGKDTAGIVQFYLTHESEAARHMMLSALVGRSDAAAYAQGIETALLAMDASDLHTSYLVKCGETARPFAQQLLAATRKRLAELRTPAPAPADDGDGALFRESSDDNAKQRIRELTGACKEIEEFLSDKPLEERLKEISVGASADDLPSAFYQRVAKMAPQTIVPTILKAAIAAPTAEKTANLLSIGTRIAYYGGWQLDGEEDQGDPFAIPPHSTRSAVGKPEYDPTPDRALWDALLADARTHTRADAYGSGLGNASVAATAASLLETLCLRGRDDRPEPPDDGDRLPIERLNRIAVAQARAILEGRPAEAMPEPEASVGTAVAARLAAVETAGVAKFLDSLTDSEYLALVRHAKNDATVRSRFAPLATAIRSFEGAPEGFPLVAGKPLTVDAIQAVVDWAKATASAGKSLLVTFSRGASAADGFVGMAVPISKNDLRGSLGSSTDEGQPSATIQAFVMGSDVNGYATWQVAVKTKPPTAADPEALAVIADMRSATDFWKAVETILTDKDFDPFSNVAFRFMILQPRDPKEKRDDEEDDVDDDNLIDFPADPF